MNIEELRTIISDTPKFLDTKILKPASVCNEGFPGTFNLSYSEAEMIENFHQYLDYDRNFIYSKIQPVIRFQDWSNIAKSDKDSYRYLSVFDLADIGGAVILKGPKNINNVISFSIDSFANFLINKLQLDKSKLRISYFAGGNVKEVTRGKYDFDFELPADNTISYWKKFDIKNDQFIPDKSRDTLLALSVFGHPTPWGFRHEINYLHEGKLLDIGTFEYLLYRPIFQDKKIVNLQKWEHLFVISAVGLERILMVKNNFSRVTDCSHVKPLIEIIIEAAIQKDYKQAEIFCQGLRVIHRVISDCGKYKNLSHKRKEKMRIFYKAIFDYSRKLGIELTSNQLEVFLKLNADLQKFYPELTLSIKETMSNIAEANERFGQTDR